MPGGKRNPLSMTNMLESIGDVVQNAKTKTENKVEHHRRGDSVYLPAGAKFVDLSIQFIGASGLPKMDVVGTADPYFVAKIDKRISFVSKVIRNTLAPVWNEAWMIKHVPSTATLNVKVMDKDEGTVTDDYIGEFSVSVDAGAKEAEITGPLFRRARGNMWLKIDSIPSENQSKAAHFPYLFDGPIRYSRHFSPTVGRLTNLDDARLYSTWKMYIRGVPLFFRDEHQYWNRNYKAAQSIFQGPTAVAVRSGIQAGHRLLYARTSDNGFGLIEKTEDIVNILHGGTSRPGSKNPNAAIQRQHANRVKPAIYTYIISSDDDSFRFSETGATFFVDFASKHALHSNCAEMVRYSGEFHPRPKGGWQNFKEEIADDEIEWEMVIDNNSGTYAPDRMMLAELRELLEYNFPGFTIYAWDREDPKLKESVDACKEYAMKYRGVGNDEFQPTANEGEVTLMHQASTKMNGNGDENKRKNSVDIAPHEEDSDNSGADAYGSYGSNVNINNRYSQSSGRYSQQPPLLPQRPVGFPRTSSDYLRPETNTSNPSHAPANIPPQENPLNMPRPTQYVPPSSEPQYIPMPEPLYNPYGAEDKDGDGDGAYPHVGSSGLASGLTQVGPGREGFPPSSVPRYEYNQDGRFGGNTTPSKTYTPSRSHDYSSLPPGCAPPYKFIHQDQAPGSGIAGASAGVGGFNPGMMGRFDPTRRM